MSKPHGYICEGRFYDLTANAKANSWPEQYGYPVYAAPAAELSPSQAAGLLAVMNSDRWPEAGGNPALRKALEAIAAVETP